LKKTFSHDELVNNFSLSIQELRLLKNKTGATRLGFAVMLKVFQNELKFPNSKSEVPKTIVKFISKQVDVNFERFSEYNWDIDNRTINHHRKQIRKFFDYKEISANDYKDLKEWLYKYILPYEHKFNYIIKESNQRFRDLKIELPSQIHLERVVSSAINTFEEELFKNTFKKIPNLTLKKIDRFIDSMTNESNEHDSKYGEINLTLIKSMPGRTSIKSLEEEIEKLKTLNTLNLPDNIFENISKKVLYKYKQRTISEDVSHLRSHPDYIRYSLLAIYLWFRKVEITDDIINIYLNVYNKIQRSASKKANTSILEKVKAIIPNKTKILYNLADLLINNPDKTIKEAVYPVFSKEKLKSVVDERDNHDIHFDKQLFGNIQSSYKSHYRKAIPLVFDNLKFNSNNDLYKPIIKAINIIKKDDSKKFNISKIPIDGIVKEAKKDFVIKDNHISKIDYELCILETLEEKLNCKEVWVSGSDRYKNPDEDMPSNFQEKRTEYYKSLNKPQNADIFIDSLKERLLFSLESFDKNIKNNVKVRIIKKKNIYRVSITPFEKQSEPQNLLKLKNEINKRWPMIKLVDVLKESSLRTDFLKHFKSFGNREILDKEILSKRLLLVLYGLGSNIGVKRMANYKNSYSNLLYIKRKYVDKDNLMNAISEIVNATLKIRDPEIWGEGTASCAADSKKFWAWDRNLRTEWHARYRGPGIMIYWHVEKKSACIYSQIKSCSSSEVASMIRGILNHNTDLDIKKTFVDTNGQSEMGFALCSLLGFNLMPRFKSPGKQKLSRVDKETSFENINDVLSRPIKWDLIAQQYDEIIKIVTALKLNIADAETILRRFSKNNSKHATHKALCELGRVEKTIFLCNYFMDEKLRIEINEGLNTVENWNSANDFIFCGKGREFTSNDLGEQELSALSLHLLQSCLVFINTLLIQNVLKDRKWFNKMTEEDFRGINPLIYGNINPFGSFKVDLNNRLYIGNEVFLQ
jgi:TnpA family transposase